MEGEQRLHTRVPLVSSRFSADATEHFNGTFAERRRERVVEAQVLARGESALRSVWRHARPRRIYKLVVASLTVVFRCFLAYFLLTNRPVSESR